MDEEIKDEVLLEIAERLMWQIVESARMLTPEGWERAANYAMLRAGWHGGDVSIVRDVRLISMRGGKKFKPMKEVKE